MIIMVMIICIAPYPLILNYKTTTMRPVSSFSPLIFVVTASLLLHFSCSSKRTNEQGFSILNQTLIQQTENNKRNTGMLLRRLEEKTHEWEYKYQAETWYPKATLITKLSANTYKQIDSLVND